MFVIVFPVLEPLIISSEKKIKNSGFLGRFLGRFYGLCCQNRMVTTSHPIPSPVETCKHTQSPFCLYTVSEIMRFSV